MEMKTEKLLKKPPKNVEPVFLRVLMPKRFMRIEIFSQLTNLMRELIVSMPKHDLRVKS